MSASKSLLTFALIAIVINCFGSAFSFRVQCTKSGDPDLLQVFNKIPERQAYTLPSGTKLYFSGGYFDNLGLAQNRLDLVHEVGIDKAFIRVFKNRAYLSDRVSSDMLARLMSDYKDELAYEDSIAKVRSEMSSVKRKEEEMSTQMAQEKRVRRTSRMHQNAKDKKRIISKKVAEREEEDGVKEEIDDFGDNFKVEKAPIFRVLLDEKEGSALLSSDFDVINDIIYENRIGNITYFSVGFHPDNIAAKKQLDELSSMLPQRKFKVVGMYKGSLISERLANQLLAEYNKGQAAK